MRILRAADRIAQPWKNGGGVTREVAVAPEGAGFDAFDWRISLAEVAASGPFSRFAGVERVLTVTEGAGLCLAVEGRPEIVLDDRSPPYPFPGDADSAATLTAGTVRDLNVMTRRGRYAAAVRRVETPGEIACRAVTTIIVTLTGAVANGQALAPYDAVVADAGEAITVDGATVRLVVIEIAAAG